MARPRPCFCGGDYVRGRCHRDDCPRAKLGNGSWHVALPKLQALFNKGQLTDRYPQLDLFALEDHVHQAGLAHENRKRQRAQASRANAHGRHSTREISDRNHRKDHPDGQRRTWRQPGQLDRPPINEASSSTARLPVKIGPATDGNLADETDGCASDVTIPDSDGSQASVFGLRSTLHEDEDEDELSEASSQDNIAKAVAERDLVRDWRTKNLMERDLDFAYVYADFEEAYKHSGLQAVAIAWSKERFLSDPDMITDMAKIRAIEATTTKVRKVDMQRKNSAVKKKMANASSLRKPGKGTEPEETEEDKLRFIEPLTQLMVDCRVGRSENTSATDKEVMGSLRRRVTRLVADSEIPTLHRAITTADEVRKFLDNRATYMGVEHVEPIVLEDFLWQSNARVRALTAIGWMCKNLQLGWPIDKIEKPNIKRSSLIGMECRQAPAAQPGMLKALEEAMEIAAEAGDPIWLAFLASWLQSMANLRLGHVLRRSVPVEQYDGWMLFFCKRGKQKHNRDGFYWGVPSKTSSDYIWTEKFLVEYNLRRDGAFGKHMMGMIFRTDSQEYLSAKAVNALTMNAVAGVVENPELLTTYSWRRMLPTLALHLNFSPAERLAIGDWKDAKAMSDEAPITLRYAEGKEGKSRVCKMMCSAVFAMLSNMNTQTFDEVPTQQWEKLASEARTIIGSKPLETKVSWRNADVAQTEGGFKAKRYQPALPGSPAKPPLQVMQDESPPLKRIKVERSMDGVAPVRVQATSSQSDGAMPKTCSQVMSKHVHDDSIMKKLLPGLQKERGEVRGNRINPELPRLVAKIHKDEGRGELWLGPLPTALRLDEILQTKPSIQIYCSLQDPTECQVETDGAEGMLIPDTVPFRCAMSNPSSRLHDMRMLKSCLVNSLRQGDNAYVHCIAGTTRAPIAASVMGAMLMGISFAESKSIVDKVRNVSLEDASHLEGAWIDRVLRENVANAEVPTGFSCCGANKDDIVVHATTLVKGGTEPICRWKKGAAGKRDFKGNIMTAETIEQASNQFGGRFCTNCHGLLRASLKLQVDHFYN